MKKTILVMAALLSALSGFAQFRQSSASSYESSSPVFSGVQTCVTLSFHPGVMTNNMFDVPAIGFGGIGLYLTRIRNVIPALPQFSLEYGGGFEWAFADYPTGYRDGGIEGRIKGDLFTLRIPLRAAYRFDLPNTEISISPFVGFEPYAVLSHKYKNYYKGDKDVAWGYYDVSSNNKFVAYGYVAKNCILLDLQLGAKVSWRNYFAAASWSFGLINCAYYKDNQAARVSQGSISVGICF